MFPNLLLRPFDSVASVLAANFNQGNPGRKFTIGKVEITLLWKSFFLSPPSFSISIYSSIYEACIAIYVRQVSGLHPSCTPVSSINNTEKLTATI